jgi:predicted NAD/FAD-binding protein
LYEAEGRLGGHSNTVTVNDDGRRARHRHRLHRLQRARTIPTWSRCSTCSASPTHASDMSFAASLDDGRFEYAGRDLAGLFAQPVNVLRGRFWRMLRDVLRFYREAPGYLAGPAAEWSARRTARARHGYSRDFARDHLLPMAAAIWSASAEDIGAYPAREPSSASAMNHGLLQLSDRPQWRTVVGGSRDLRRAAAREPARRGARRHAAVTRVERGPRGPQVIDRRRHATSRLRPRRAGHPRRPIARPAGGRESRRAAPAVGVPLRAQSSRCCTPTRASCHVVGAPGRAGTSSPTMRRTSELCVSYWMNRLQSLDSARDWFVTLNPSDRSPIPPSATSPPPIAHPQFDAAAIAAQDALWDIQGSGAPGSAALVRLRLSRGRTAGGAPGGGTAGRRRAALGHAHAAEPRRPAARRLAPLAGERRMSDAPRGPAHAAGDLLRARDAPSPAAARASLQLPGVLPARAPVALARLPNRWLSRERFNLMSFSRPRLRPAGRQRSADLGARAPGRRRLRPRPTAKWCCRPFRACSATSSIRSRCGTATIVAGALRAVIAEVSNTFGERHDYVLNAPDGGAEIDADRWLSGRQGAARLAVLQGARDTTASASARTARARPRASTTTTAPAPTTC